MAILERWGSAIVRGGSPLFSPSGEALAVKPFGAAPTQLPQTLEVHFADSRVPLVVESDSPLRPLAWASETEFVFRVEGKPYGKLPHSTIQVVSLTDGEVSLILEEEKGRTIASADWAGKPGYLSCLADPQVSMGLFEMNARTGKLRRQIAFDRALEKLLVHPQYGHALSYARQEVALIAQTWPLAGGALQKAPCQLYLLSATGECQEVPGTHGAKNPLWSPDGSLIAFERASASGNNGVWVIQRENLSVHDLCKSPSFASTILHPSGILLTRLEEGLVFSPGTRLVTAGGVTTRWREFILQAGHALPL